MSDAAYVHEARGYAEKLVRLKARGWGDKPRAIDEAARLAGLSRGTIWGLIYNRKKWLREGVLDRVRNAYLAEREAQLRALEHEIEITKQVAGPDCDSVRAAETLIRQAHALGEEE